MLLRFIMRIAILLTCNITVDFVCPVYEKFAEHFLTNLVQVSKKQVRTVGQ